MRKRRLPALRFWEKVEVSAHGCWEWRAATRSGYGQFYDGTRFVPAHRFAYELMVGPIPAGKLIDHLCRNRACVRPDHIEPVTNRENIMRGIGRTARHYKQTRCWRGHEFTPENTYHRVKGGRQCRECTRLNARIRYRLVRREGES